MNNTPHRRDASTSLVQKIALVFLWILGGCMAFTGLYVLGKGLFLTIMPILVWVFLSVPLFFQSSGSGAATAIIEVLASTFTTALNLLRPALIIFCIFAVGFLCSFRLYRTKTYVFSILLSVLFLVWLPLVHAQQYFVGTGVILPLGADPITYRNLSGSGSAGAEYGVDDKQVFCDNKVLQDADPKTFTSFNLPPTTTSALDYYAKDAQHVYYACEVIPDADPKTFTPTKDGYYGKDAFHVYKGTYLIEGADSATFTSTSNDLFARDKNYVYLDQSMLPGADPKSFVVLPGGLYGKDKNTVFDLTHKVPLAGADYTTFASMTEDGVPVICGATCEYDAKDKYHFYREGSVAPQGSPTD